MTDVLNHLRLAVKRGQLDAASMLALFEELILQGQGSQIEDALRARGLGPLDSVGLSLEAASIDGLDSSRSGSWLNAEEGSVGGGGGQHFAPEEFMEKIAYLRAHHAGDSRPPERYAFGEEIARGGVGGINLVRDRDLLRTLVMKTLLEGNKVSDYVLKKFIEEAQITGQLEHPNIVPVHDFGCFSGGEVFFTMKLVKGRTIKDIIRRLRKPGEFVDADWSIAEFTRTRLVQIFQQVCLAIGFANSRGVVHRDIKPSNVMVGDFGEVLVLDWGVAKVMGRSEESDPADRSSDRSASSMGLQAPGAQSGEAVSTLRSRSQDSTLMGVVTGTPSYMAPEQAAGRVDEVDARSDVYALGALLYEILTYVPPFRGKNFRQTLAAVLTQPVTPPSVRAPQNEVPRLLEDIVMRCLQKRREDRYQSSREIVADLERYLSGVEDLDRRSRLSREKVDEGLTLSAAFRAARARVETLRTEVAELEWHLHGHEPIEAKRSFWSREADVTEAVSEMQRLYSGAAQAFMAAIGFDLSNDQASNELARLYWFKLREAELEGDEAAVIAHRLMVATYNRGFFDQQMKGEGRVVIRSDPPGVSVTAARYVEVDLQLQALMEEEKGTTPLNNIPLAEGNWQLCFEHPGYMEVRCPIQIDRGEVSDVVVRLFRPEEQGEHYLYVPGGNFMMGGDDACVSARHRRVAHVPDFLMARYPVTCIEYLSFIQDTAIVNPEGAQARCPRLKSSEGFLWTVSATGTYDLPARDREGLEWQPYWPIFGVSYDDASAYCEWHTTRVGLAVRLPTEEEWEKAARGPDRRKYPWGNRFDATFCKMASSRPGRPSLEPVGSFIADCSPYGVFDMAGLLSEFTDSSFAADPALRVLRGGNYETSSENGCRVTYRVPVWADETSLTSGFRLVRDPPAAAQSMTQRKLVRPQFV
ncbi:MAG: hypothetical protein EXR76_03440 [Myxococcales bacterium]|nr:hypothetical protein [Myxococcales bacterium]